MTYDLVRDYINTVSSPNILLKECVYSESYTLVVGTMEVRGLPFSLFKKAEEKSTQKQKLKECERIVSKILKGVKQWQK